jgi:hypothetical protein
METGTSKWIGISGIVYEFTDYTLDTVFRENVIGNYAFSNKIPKEEGYTLNPIYIGEGVLKDRISFRLNEGKVQEKRCNCVSVRILKIGEDSKQIEEDLLAAYPAAYIPTGCNIKEGG